MNKDLITVTNAKYVRDFILELAFSDGVSAEIDFSGWIEKYPFFAPLKIPITSALLARRLDGCLAERRRHRSRNSARDRLEGLRSHRRLT
jgi:hypothetical protein